jgi:DNA-binding NarL/FixJ family response regulator
MGDPLKICIVDDNRFFRDGLRFFIESETNWRVVQEESSGTALLKRGFMAPPDIVLMDINMPGLNGIDTTFKLLNDHPKANTKVIAVTMYADHYFLETLIGAGFKGCILKKNVYKELRDAVRKIQAGRLYFKDQAIVP